MIKQLLNKLINKPIKKLNNKSAFCIKSLFLVSIPHYESSFVENQYGVDVVYHMVNSIAILTNKPYIHIKSNKTIKELFNSKNNECLKKLTPITSEMEIIQYMRKHGLTENDMLTRQQIINLENEINAKHLSAVKRPTLQF